MNTKDFYYDLPKELIAQDPLSDRSSSKLLYMNRKTGDITHTVFSNIVDYFAKGDVLVLNETKVIPARLIGVLVEEDETKHREVEIFLLKRNTKNIWECLVRPGKKLRQGSKVIFGNGKLKCEIKEVLDTGNRIVEFIFDGIWEEVLNELGEMPLPPYITHKLQDKNRYQTVYAKNEGSVAAPTAGLHFTNDLLKKIEDKGVIVTKLTLHVGLGTFRPVKEEKLENHLMHEEEYFVPKDTAYEVNKAKEEGRRVIACGTTSVRTLESACVLEDNKYILKEGHNSTKIFIYPGYEFKIIDGLITNFHLPESTLIMLVSAFCGRENILKAYNEAVKLKYRFFSFGDACLFL